jgi:hypothetical protein
MKIKIESDRIIQAVKNLEGVELVVENADDAKEAIALIMAKAELLEPKDREKLKDVQVTAFQKYETSAVTYKMIFLLEFVFVDSVSLDEKMAVIKRVNEFFETV